MNGLVGIKPANSSDVRRKMAEATRDQSAIAAMGFHGLHQRAATSNIADLILYNLADGTLW